MVVRLRLDEEEYGFLERKNEELGASPEEFLWILFKQEMDTAMRGSDKGWDEYRGDWKKRTKKVKVRRKKG